MKDKRGGILDIVVVVVISGAVICATVLVLTTSVLALIVKPVKLFYRGVVFVVSASWNWIRFPLR